MPYVCMIRSDIEDGTLQILDLEPDSSQRNPCIDPIGQTKYVDRVTNGTVAALVVDGANTETSTVTSGLAAYLIDNVESGGLAAGTDSLTPTEANTIATNIINDMDSGAASTLANLNTLIAATAASSELSSAGGSSSTGSLIEVLQILAGGVYLLPAGSEVQVPTGTFSGQNGSFPTETYRPSYNTGAFVMSFAAGSLAEYADATWSYYGTAGAAVLVYDDDGSVYT